MTWAACFGATAVSGDGSPRTREAPLPGCKATDDRNAAQMIGREVVRLPAPTSKARGVFQSVSEVDGGESSNSLPVSSPRARAQDLATGGGVQRGFVAKIVVSEDRNHEKVGLQVRGGLRVNVIAGDL